MIKLRANTYDDCWNKYIDHVNRGYQGIELPHSTWFGYGSNFVAKVKRSKGQLELRLEDENGRRIR